MNAGHGDAGRNAMHYAMHFPAFALGTFPTLRDALAALGVGADLLDEMAAKHAGRVTWYQLGDARECRALLQPAGGQSVRVDYLFSEGFGDRCQAEAVAMEGAQSGWPEPAEAHRWHVMSRFEAAGVAQ